MTNREYINSLNNEEFAYYIWDKQPWADYSFIEAGLYEAENDDVWAKACYNAFARWLNFEHQEEE